MSTWLWLAVVLLGGTAEAAQAQEPELLTLEMYSPSVERHLNVNVLLPAGYAESTTRYPVLYLLHGMHSSYQSWWSPEGVGAHAAALGNLIVVMPDGGNFWYVNWPSSQPERNLFGQNRWEDFIAMDLISHIDRRFRTVARRQGRAIAGHSMGGFGALAVGLRHPELFASIGSTSGYLDYARAAALELGRSEVSRRPRRRQRLPDVAEAVASAFHRQNPAIGTDGFSTLAERSPVGRPFETVEEAEAHDPFVLIDRIAREALPHIYLDCGTEDNLFGFNRDFAQQLMARRIPFDFSQSPGKHDDAYRNRAVGRLMSTQFEVMQRALASRPVQEEESP